MTAIFNWGVIGPGRIAHNFGKALTALPDASLAAVASRDPERGLDFADLYQGDTTFIDYADLLADTLIDAVYIATPHRFHYDLIRQCIEAGKPVLCEKPMTVTAEQAQELHYLAHEHQVFLMEAMWSKFLPVWQEVRAWLDQGAIGQVQWIQSSFGLPIARDPCDRLLNRELAGGVLLDMGVYNVALSQYIMGQNPVSITCDGMLGETGVDERTSAIMKYHDDNGSEIISQFTCSFGARLPNDLTIIGSLGEIHVPSMFWAAEQAVLRVHGAEPEVFREPFRATGFEYQMEEVMRCVRRGQIESPVHPLSSTVGNQQAMDRILQHLGVEYPFAPREKISRFDL